MTTAAPKALPEDLFDTITLASLAFVFALVPVAYAVSLRLVPASTTPGYLRFLFVWHAFDFLCHSLVESSYLYHCFASYLPLSRISAADVAAGKFYMTPHWLGTGLDRVYGPQAGVGEGGLLSGAAGLWMVYARADKRWAGADLVSFLHSFRLESARRRDGHSGFRRGL
jgi:hypothetical protein